MKRSDEEQLLRNLNRDLCTLTREEILAEWNGTPRDLLAEQGVDLEKLLVDHNPIYFLAQEVWFDNKKGATDEKRFLYAPFHRDILCKAVIEYALQTPAERKAGLVLVFPRDTFKSVFNHGVIPHWFSLRMKRLHKRDARICLSHHKELQASASLVRLRDKASHPFMKDNWPEFYHPDPKALGSMTLFNWPCKETGRQQEPSVYAIGLGGTMTGWHFDLMNPDDSVTEDHINSRPIREAAKDKYEATRFMLDAEGCEVYTDTPYHVNDLTRKMVEANVEGVPLYAREIRPALSDEGILLHPFRLSKEVLEKRRKEEIARRGTDLLYQLQYQCSWKADRTTVADESWFRFIDPLDINPRSWRVLFIDPAWKGDKNWGSGCDAGFAAIQFERRERNLFRILLDGAASNEMSQSDGIREAIRIGRKWGITTFYAHEPGGYGYTTTLKQESRNDGWTMDALELSGRSAQAAQPTRIGGLMRQLEQGRFFINSALKGGEFFEMKWKPQILDWPQAEPDDAIDATAHSCSEEVMEKYAPLPSRSSMKSQKEAPTAYRTRYCLN